MTIGKNYTVGIWDITYYLTDTFKWGQTISIQVTATDGVRNEIVLYEQGNTNVIHSYKTEE